MTVIRESQTDEFGN